VKVCTSLPLEAYMRTVPSSETHTRRSLSVHPISARRGTFHGMEARSCPEQEWMVRVGRRVAPAPIRETFLSSRIIAMGPAKREPATTIFARSTSSPHSMV